MKAIAISLSGLLALAACGNAEDAATRARTIAEKCERTFDRLAPLIVKGSNRPDRNTEVNRCRAAVAATPEREMWLDCILDIDGDLTADKLVKCQSIDQQLRGAKRPAQQQQANTSAPNSSPAPQQAPQAQPQQPQQPPQVEHHVLSSRTKSD